jgi:flagellin-like protein
MKGITPVISIVLLLLITITIIGFVFVFFSRTMSTATNTTGTQIEAQQEKLQKTLVIENIQGTSLTLRSTGTLTIASTEVSYYIDNAAVNCTGWSSLAPGEIVSCTLSSSCGSGSTLKVVAPGGFDQYTC